MWNPLVSIVLPVYNVERYLDRCISSVVGQTYENLEIVLVDDGARDSCPAKCDAWAERDQRVRVIHKENQGLGMARNTGFEASSGDYVFFFDSDDFVDPDLVEACVRRASSGDVDIVLYGIRSVSEDGGKVLEEHVPCCPKDCYVSEEVADALLPFLLGPDWDTGEDWQLVVSACTCMFDRHMLRRCGFRFASERDVISEDVYSIVGLYRHVERVAVIEKAFYTYRANPRSLTRAYRRDRLCREREFYQKTLDLAGTYGYSQLVRERLMAPYVSNVIAALKGLAVSDEPAREKRMQASALSHDAIFRDVYDRICRKRHLGWKRKALLWAVHADHPRLVMLLCVCAQKLKLVEG